MISWAELFQLEWAHPWWALLALQPVLMLLLLKLRHRQVLHYADAHLLPWVLRGGEQGGLERWKQVLNLAAWLLLACAAAGPRLPLALGEGQQATQHHEMDIMVLLDVSPSMQAQDISPQRLQRAKLELLDLLPRLRGERLGLIAFSGSAGLLMPLSRDYSALRYYLDIAQPALFDAPGTALASALELALRYLPPASSRQRAILLLSDAEASALSGLAGAAVWEAADKLKQAGVRVYILGVGSAAGATIPQANGYPLVNEGVEVVSMLDEADFGELAGKTGGKFAQVADGDGDWRTLYERGLLALPGGKQPKETVQAWREMHALFLLPALLLFAFRLIPVRLNKVSPAALLLAGVIAAGSGVQDAYASETEAHLAYRQQNHALAQTLYGEVQGYNGRMGEGAAAYRRKDYPYAIKQFSAALLQAHNEKQREQALFNLGNSYFMAAGFRAAADAFLGVLKYTPDNSDARANLALAAGKLAELNKPGKNPQGIAGRRGRETAGGMGEDATDKPLSIEDSDDKKNTLLRAGSELEVAENARLRVNGNQLAGENANPDGGREIAYRAALKKLELATDQPVPLHQSLIRIEAAREYVPLPEMSPW